MLLKNFGVIPIRLRVIILVFPPNLLLSENSKFCKIYHIHANSNFCSLITWLVNIFNAMYSLFIHLYHIKEPKQFFLGKQSIIFFPKWVQNALMLRKGTGGRCGTGSIKKIISIVFRPQFSFLFCLYKLYWVWRNQSINSRRCFYFFIKENSELQKGTCPNLWVF